MHKVIVTNLTSPRVLLVISGKHNKIVHACMLLVWGNFLLTSQDACEYWVYRCVHVCVRVCTSFACLVSLHTHTHL
jgi:hypothetical protein